MDTVFIWSCECGKHRFVFPVAPPRPVECVCPECKKLQTIDPTRKASAVNAKKDKEVSN